VRLRLVRLESDGSTSVAALNGERWVPLAPLTDAAWGTDLLAFLAGGAPVREQASDLIRDSDPAPVRDGALLPFRPRSFRDFSIFPAHMEQSGRNLVRKFFPAPAGAALTAYERLTRRTFPPVKPKKGYFAEPAFYMGNHTAFMTDGEVMPWPRHTDYLDFELELGFVLVEPVADATPQQGEAAIGGFFILNDWSARDVQAHEYRNSVFGPVVKAKTFNNAIGPVVATADELLPHAGSLRGAVRVNGETWVETTSAGAAFSLGDLVAHASAGERLGPGDVLGTGTLPGGCGLELDRWIKPGDVVELELERLGTLTNTIGPRPG
jgi:2-keto-4-pentenoate hydratase/2-oxohepta-3-ene-1,7-dioic acid hydratase in catechol pathway